MTQPDLYEAPMPELLSMDLARLIGRLKQIDAKRPVPHFLWQRVMTQDVPRLLGYVLPEHSDRCEAVEL